MSAIPCGCDEAAGRKCDQHKIQDLLEHEQNYMMFPRKAALSTVGPTRTSILPEDAKGRKEHPVASGVLDYFPDALVAVSNVSWKGNEQHNPGEPLHWAREKSTDEADTMIRHFLQRGSLDTDGIRHTAKMAWRALALLQKELENERSA